MIDIKHEELLDIIHELAHIKDEEGNDVPYFCFASDVSVDLDAKEEEIAIIAAKEGYKIFKVFPGETIGGGLVLVADGATLEPVENMYQEFYGEVPEIAELKLDDEDHLVEIEKELKEDYKSDLESKIRDILEYEKQSKDEDGGKPYLFEIDDAEDRASKAEGDPFWIKRFGDEEPPTDFSKLQVHDATTDEYGANPPVASFMIAGGCNGSGNWTDYLEDLKDTFEKLKDATGCDPLLYQIDTDICDDVWTGFVFMYDHRDNAIEESVKNLDEAFKNKRPKVKKVGDPNAKAMWGRTRSQVFKSKKGKGSFTRHPKHRLSEVYSTPRDEDIKKFIDMLKDSGWIIESVDTYDSMHGDDDVKDIHIQIIDSNVIGSEPEATKAYIDSHREEIEARIDTVNDIIDSFDPTGKFRITYAFGFGGTSKTGIDCTGKLTAGLDVRAEYVEDDLVELNPVDEELDLDVTDENDYIWGGSEEFEKALQDKATALNAELEIYEPISPKRRDSFWYDGYIGSITYKDVVIDVFATGESNFILDGEYNIGSPSEAEEHGLFTDDDIAEANAENRIEWDANNWFDFRIVLKEQDDASDYDEAVYGGDLGYDCVYDVEDALNPADFIPTVVNDFLEYIGKTEESEVTESKKKKVNVLKAAANKHKKTDKKGAMGWFVKFNAGNVEQNIQHFNHVNGGDASSTITAPAGLGEAVELDVSDRYIWEFDVASHFRTKGYEVGDDGAYTGASFWYNSIPEICMKVSREDYMNNRLLRKRKNKQVLLGVEQFFETHKSAKYCIISCRDVTRHNKYVNAYRVLAEKVEKCYNDFMNLKESQNSYYVLSDGKNPYRAHVYPEIDDLDGFISSLEDHKEGAGYWELLHYVNGNPVKIWSTEEGKIKEDIELDVVKPKRSPAGIQFEAKPREDFLHHGRGYWKRYPEFICPSNGVQIRKTDYLNGKYLLVKAADKVVAKFFKDNPRNQFCVLLAYDVNHKPVDANVMFGDKLPEKLNLVTEKAEKHDTLNPKLWDESNNLKPEVREKILEIVKEFTDGLEEDEIKFKIKDIVLVGSNCSYNYNDKSDLDIHIRMDTNSLKCPDDLYPLLYGAYRALFNNKMDIDFYGIPVEIYVETDDTEQLNDVTEARKQSALKSNGIFSVMNNEWIKEPVAEDIPEVDEAALEKELSKWLDRYNEIVRGEELEGENPLDAVLEAITQKQHYSYYGPIYRFGRLVKQDAELDTMAVSLKQAINNLLFKAAKLIGYDRSRGAEVSIDTDAVYEVEPEYSENPEEIVDNDVCPKCHRFLLNDSGECPLCDLGDESVLEESLEDDKIAEIEDFIEDIYDSRKESIATEGEYGIGNLVFKEIRNLGYLDNLKELKNALKSRKLSLESYKEDIDEHLSKSELKRRVPNITEEDVKSWISDEIGWDMTIDPDKLTKADYEDLPSGWIVTQDFGLKNLFKRTDYSNMTAFIKDILMKYGDKYYIGTYKMKYGKYRGYIAIDVNKIIEDTVDAIEDGLKNNQESIYRYDEYLFLTHNLISRRDGKKRPAPFTKSELKDYGLDSHIVGEPLEGCLNIELVDGIFHTDIPVYPVKK